MHLYGEHLAQTYSMPHQIARLCMLISYIPVAAVPRVDTSSLHFLRMFVPLAERIACACIPVLRKHGPLRTAAALEQYLAELERNLAAGKSAPAALASFSLQ